MEVQLYLFYHVLIHSSQSKNKVCTLYKANIQTDIFNAKDLCYTVSYAFIQQIKHTYTIHLYMLESEYVQNLNNKSEECKHTNTNLTHGPQCTHVNTNISF